MRLFGDYHTHTSFSGDSEAPMESMVKQAVRMGLKELVFTDHVDYEYADPNFEMIDFEEYTAVFAGLQRKYGHKINLLMGVEIGFQPHVTEKINRLLSQLNFEFVICSTHMADRLDFYTGAFFEGKDQHAAYQRYFANVLEAVKTMEGFDVYGHLDFIVRYGNYNRKELSYSEHAEIIEEILRHIIQKGKGIEINTSGYRYGLGCLHPHLNIIKRYREMGGEIITVGSDAHAPGDIASGFKGVYDVLRETGFKYLTAYSERQPRFIKVP